MDVHDIGWLNSLNNEISVLEKFASPDYAERLALGPIAGFIDTNELYWMYYDFRPVLIPEHGEIRTTRSISEAAADAMKNFEKLLEIVIFPDEREKASDSEIVRSNDWKRLQELAKIAADRLKECL